MSERRESFVDERPSAKLPNDRRGWLSHERMLALVLLAMTIIATYLSYRILQPFLPALCWALALGIIADPLHQRIAGKVRFPGVAAGISVVLVVLLFVSPLIFVTQQMVLQVAVGAERIQQTLESGRLQEAVERFPAIDTSLDWIDKNVDVAAEIRRVVGAITADIGSFVTGSVWTATQFLITILTLFYFFRDRNLAIATLRSLLPLTDRETDELLSRVSATIYATVYGTMLVAFVQGALGGLMFYFLGLPAPILWGVVMAFLAIVPILGAFVVWVPAALILAIDGNWGSALVLTAWGTIVVSLVDNFLYPIFVGDRLRLHTLPVFFAIFGGLIVFGTSGVILGPLILAVTLALFQFWRDRTAEGRVADKAL